MAFYFKSLCSSSNGNCLLLRTNTTTVVIDCGFASMKKTRNALSEDVPDLKGLDAVIVSHLHGDHIGYYPLRVLEEYDTEIRVHEACLDHLKLKHFNGYGFAELNLKPFTDCKFTVGDLTITPFELPHHPDYPTYGFAIEYEDVKAVIATDFYDWQHCVEYFIDADFIFVESNHDLEMLSRYFNPNSRFHMSNPQTAQLLHAARRQSKKPPKVVMLGHISSQRNDARIALKEVTTAFEANEQELDFHLCAAPLRSSSEVFEIC
jgi:phosphoribosyl 1,2-cyclic phosphodiesterase